jgi:hypothetical protein
MPMTAASFCCAIVSKWCCSAGWCLAWAWPWSAWTTVLDKVRLLRDDVLVLVGFAGHDRNFLEVLGQRR